MAQKNFKRYSLTKIGEDPNRRLYYRRDAASPVIIHVRQTGSDALHQIMARLVNISEDGCLLTADSFPPQLIDLYIIFPGLPNKVSGDIRNQGQFTLNIQFDTQLPTRIVDRIAALGS